ncbi:hypothetical protein Peur_030684 [Populus x canadensis]
MAMAAGGGGEEVLCSWWCCCGWEEDGERWLREPDDSNCSFLSAAVQGRWEGEGNKSMVLAVLVCFSFPPVRFQSFPVFSPSFSISFPPFLASHCGYLHFKLPSPFSFKRALSLLQTPPLSCWC